MPVEQDFIAYHQSIGAELKNSKNRVRNLIGDVHWLTDGEHKEGILRKVISTFAPEIMRIGKGFVCYPNPAPGVRKASTQIDILITSKGFPTLFKDFDLHFVTPDAVEAIIEVKTKSTRGHAFEETLLKLSDECKRIRASSCQRKKCWSGLFVYDSEIDDFNYILETIQQVCNGDIERTINCVAIGTNCFVRFWENGHATSSPERVPMWHLYELNDLAQNYLISNLISHLSPQFEDNAEDAWFPVPNTKEAHRRLYSKLYEPLVRPF